MTVANRARAQDARVLSGDGYVLKKMTFAFQRRDGGWRLHCRRVLQYSASMLAMMVALPVGHGEAADLAVPAGTTYNLGTRQEAYDQVTVSSGGIVSSSSGAVLTVNQGAVSGTNGLTGGMQLTKDGSGTLELNGANSYSGGTLVRNGTVRINADLALGTNYVQFDNTGVAGAPVPILDLADGVRMAHQIWLDGTGAIFNVSSGTATLAGNIITLKGLGGAGLTKNGAGELVLVSGDGPWTLYRGDTIINQGTLTLSGGNEFTNRLGIGTLRINGATLKTTANAVATIGNDTIFSGGATIESNGTVTLVNGISGTGNLTKDGTGILELGAPSNYTGNTSILAGTLSLIGTSTLPASTVVSVGMGGKFEINGTRAAGNEQVQIAGINGSGIIDLTSNNLYVGGTGLSSEFSGTLRGRSDAGGTDPSLIKQGTGTLTLNGTYNSGIFDASTGLDVFEGNIDIWEGRLLANGNTGSNVNVIVQSGAVLGGTGRIGNLYAVGTVSPGTDTSSIGSILRVANYARFDPDSVLRVRVNTTTSDKLITGGQVEIDSTATVRADVSGAESGYSTSQRYTILTAGTSLLGQFGSAALFCGGAPCAFLKPELDKDTKNVYLTLKKDTTSPPPPPPPDDPDQPDSPQPPGPTLTLTPNQIAALRRIDSVGSSPLKDAVIYLNVDEAPRALDLISGEVHAEVPRIALDDSNLVTRAILDRLRRTPAPVLPSFVAASTMTSYTADKAVRVAPTAVQREWSIDLWGQGFGAFGKVQGDSNVASFDRSTGGFVLGADATFGERWRAGFAGAFTSTSFDIDGRQSSGSLDSWHIAAYGGTSFGGALNLRGGAALAHNDAEVHRSISFRGFSGDNAANYSGTTLNMFGEVGYGMSFGALALEPFAGLSYVRFESDALREDGTMASALVSPGTSFDQTYSHLGLRLSTDLPVGTSALSANASVAWRYAFADTAPTAPLALAAGRVPITVAAVPVDRNSLIVETGLDWAITPAAKLGAKYGGSFGDRAQDHAFKGHFDVRF